jgi:hypothetical protein
MCMVWHAHNVARTAAVPQEVCEERWLKHHCHSPPSSLRRRPNCSHAAVPSKEVLRCELEQRCCYRVCWCGTAHEARSVKKANAGIPVHDFLVH